MIALISRKRMVAIEFAMWRSGRKGRDRALNARRVK